MAVLTSKYICCRTCQPKVIHLSHGVTLLSRSVTLRMLVTTIFVGTLLPNSLLENVNQIAHWKCFKKILYVKIFNKFC